MTEKGYSALTMRMLASELGVKASSLYNHITSKQEILQIIAFNVAEKFTQAMEGVISEPIGPFDKLKKMISLHIDITLENPKGMECLQRNWMFLEGDHLISYKSLRAQYEQNLNEIIGFSIEEKKVKDVDTHIISYYILSILRTMYEWFPGQKSIDDDKFKESLKLLILSGLGI